MDRTETDLVATIADGLPVGIWVARAPGGEFVYANQAFAEIMGMPARSDVAVGEYGARYGIFTRDGQPYPETRMPFVRARVERQTVLADDLAIHSRDGRRVMVRALARPLFDTGGEIQFIAIAFIDVTAEVEMQRELASAERKLRHVVEHAPLILFAFDTEGKVTLSEGRGLESMGLRSGELVGQSVYELYKDAPEVLAATKRALLGEEFQSTIHAGQVTFDVAFAPIRNAEGQVAGVSGVTTNVTERDRQRNQLLEADRMHALGTLAASVAHEVNTPLSYVAESLDHVLSELPRMVGARDAEARLEQLIELLHEARRGVEQVKVIASDLHSFSRPADRTGAVDLRAVVESAVRMASNETLHHARLRVEIEGTPHVLGNESRLAQVFLNLLVNAAQALPEGQASENEIEVRVSEGNGFVRAQISDTGRGIAPQALPHVFEPFFTTKPVGSGIGLGLSVSKSIVDAHGGEIVVESELGQGTTVRVILPSCAPPRAEAPEPLAQTHRARPRVLIVDDNESLRRVLQVTLRPHCELELVSSGHAALERILGDVPYDLVLCDLMMPDVTGMDVFERVRERRPGAEKSICFMSGGAFTPRARAFLDEVPNVCLRKPFDFAEAIRSQLEARGQVG
jgi:PAS domain S-box-containing protein